MKLFLENGKSFNGQSFGADTACEGEVVFTTGMTGYLEVLTDPSYFGQIVVFTFPLVGNYGVFEREDFAEQIDRMYESGRIWVKGVIMAEESVKYSHELGFQNFAQWLKDNDIPALTGVDTRALTQELRETGTILGSIGTKALASYDEDLKIGRFVPFVSPQTVDILEPENPIGKTIAFIDCGAKNGIFRNFLKRGVRVIRLPYDHSPFDLQEKFDGIFFSNGPGDPETLHETITIAKEAIAKDFPIFGICLGNQILGLASGGKTVKMKYGHRGANQPVQDIDSKRCLITTQNHGYVVEESSLSADWKPWFKNLNDQSVEGIQHVSKQIRAVQFHPEACAGPEDAQYLFDDFIAQL